MIIQLMVNLLLIKYLCKIKIIHLSIMTIFELNWLIIFPHRSLGTAHHLLPHHPGSSPPGLLIPISDHIALTFLNFTPY